MIATSFALNLIKTYISEEKLRNSCKHSLYASIKWQLKNSTSLERTVIPINIASLREDLSVIKLLMDEGFPVSNSAKALAAANGHLHILKTLNDGDLNPIILQYAISGGSVRVVKWLLANKCSFDESSTLYAVKYNRVRILEILMEHRVPVHRLCLRNAIYSNRKRIVKLLLKSGVRLCEDAEKDVKLKLEKILSQDILSE